MVENQEPNLDGDGESCSSSSFQRTVILRDWWLVKCSKEFEGKRFGVAGTEITASFVEKRAMRGVFTSSPIIKAFDIFTLQASDGICITLQGFLDKKRVVESGFIPEISREFIFGFPPCWEQICNKCFGGGGSFGTGNDRVHSVIDKACSPILSPCKNTKRNLEDNPARSIDKSMVVAEKNTAEISDKDGRSGSSRARDVNTARRTSPRRQPKSGGKSAEDVRKLELSIVQNTINDGDHGSEGLDKAKSSDLERDECEAIDNEVILHTGAELLTLEHRKGAAIQSLFKDLDKSRKPEKKEQSKERKKAVNRSSNVVEPMNHSGTNVKSAENERERNASRLQNPTNAMDNEVASVLDWCGKRHTGADNIDKTTSKNATKELPISEQRKGILNVTKTSLSLSKDLTNNSKPGKKGKSKKSEKTLKNDCNVVEPIVKEEETMSWEKTKRKIDFDLEVTPEKEPKKQMTDVDSTGSLGQKRSRSGRVLVSPLEFWRNQVPVYDMGRNLIQVDEGHETNSSPFKGKGSNSRKARR